MAIIGDHAAALRFVADSLHPHCRDCIAGAALLRMIADEIQSPAAALGSLGGRVAGASKRRGDADYYRALSARAGARRGRPRKRPLP